MTDIVPGGEPYYFPGDRTGVLLIHGFTGTPVDLRGIAEFLAEQGRSALGVRLFGHATDEDDLSRARYQDWTASVEDGFHLLRPNVDRIVALGISMGGALALLLAARFRLDGVVAMATPFQLPADPRLPFARLLSRFWPRIPKPQRGEDRSEGSSEPSLSYKHYPTRAIAELDDLLSQMRRSLPRVNAATLLIQSRDDPSLGVSPQAMPQIYRSLGSRRKEMIWLEEAGHVVTRGSQKGRVFQLVGEFIDDIHSPRDPSPPA